MTFQDPTQRFSDRVSDYMRNRPHYPEAILGYLQKSVGLKPEQVLADMGCGTGISSELFLKNGNRVFGIEPNAPMLEGARVYLKEYDRFEPVLAQAEHSSLPDASVDLVLSAQAFHWFNSLEARLEFRRHFKTSGAYPADMEYPEACRTLSPWL